MTQILDGNLTTYRDIIDRVKYDDVGKFDQVSKFQNMQFLFDDKGLYLRARNGHETDARMTDWATGEMCQRLRIPRQYWDRCPDRVKALNGNYWLHNAMGEDGLDTRDGSGLLRYRAGRSLEDGGDGKDELRAFLTDRYTPVNNIEVAEVLLDAVGTNPMELAPGDKSFMLDDLTMFIRMLYPGIEIEVRPGDTLKLGLQIGNSEVGARRVTIEAFLFRGMCSNGMIFGYQGVAKYEHVHRGIDRNDLLNKLNEVAAEVASKQALIGECLHHGANVSVEKPEERIKRLVAEAGYGEDQQKQAITYWEQDEAAPSDATRYGVMNALTRLAQDLPQQKRVELETAAGSWLVAAA